jgi:hypothetical protein
MRLLYLVVCEEACHHLLLARRLAKGSVNRLVGQSTTHIIDFSRQMCLPTCREMDIDTVLLIEPITEYRLIRRTVTIIGLGLQMLCVKHLPECKIIRLAKGACWDDPFFLLDFSKSSTTHDKPHPSKTWQGQQYRRRIQVGDHHFRQSRARADTAIPVSRSLKPDRAVVAQPTAKLYHICREIAMT